MLSYVEICRVKENLGYRIRKLRENKDYSQENMAVELGMSISAYSKIERGITDPSIGRIGQIAKILEVSISEFFQEETMRLNKAEDINSPYGFATKSDIHELLNMINSIKQEIARLKASADITKIKKKKKI